MTSRPAGRCVFARREAPKQSIRGVHGQWIATRPRALAMTGGTLRLCEAQRAEAIHAGDGMNKLGYVYILFNKRNGTLYTGVTSDLIRRVYEHKEKLTDGFTKRYGVDKLGYYEVLESITDAISREKQIKSGSRKKKLDLIEKSNPMWKDLYDEIL